MTPGDRRFPKDARLLSPADFDRVYRHRRSAADGALVMYGCPAASVGESPGPESVPARIGLSVSRRVGNAVVRNRWKRRLREAFRVVRSRMPAGQDFIVVVRPARVPRGEEGADRIEGALLALARRIVTRPGYAEASPSAGRPAPRRR